jgi:CheY-like chemotaxis protein/anti-sigma regulatory factor (Ser/Thr protein kinase)
VHPAVQAKRIELRTKLDEDVGEVFGDPNRLQQVMWNLLSNAVKFTPTGGKVEVALTREGGEAVIRVSDSGIGIAPDFLPHVFDRFRQQDASITRKHGGLGLGLSIVKQLVELHGGTISVDSGGQGAGATFIVRLPLAEPAPASTPSAPSPLRAMPGDGTADLSGVKVLVVDDAADTLDVLEQILRHSGAAIVSASTAAQALDCLDSERPDVIVSDIGMPETDGLELMRRVRRRAAHHGGATPAIALTALTRQDDRDKAFQAGFTDYLSKPVEPSALVASIVHAAKQRQAAPFDNA